MKRCSKCGIIRNESEFNKDKKSKSGLASWCKVCIKTHYIDNREKILERTNKYKAENHEKVKN